MDYFRVLAQMMQEQGRGNDTLLAHITPEEARLLKRRGGSGTRNPVTGLLEFDDGGGDGGGGDGGGGDGGGGDGGGGSDSGGGEGTGEGAGGSTADDGFGGGPDGSFGGAGFGGMADDGFGGGPGGSFGGGQSYGGMADDGFGGGPAGSFGDGYGGASVSGGYSDGGGGGDSSGGYYGGSTGPVAAATPASRSLISQAFLNMLAANRNIGVPSVSIASNYAPRTIAPTASLLPEGFAPMAPQPAPAPMAPRVFEGLLGGFMGGGSFGAPPAPTMQTASSAPMPLMASRGFAPVLSADDFLRMFRGY